MVTVFKFALCRFLIINLLIKLSFFPSENTSNLLSYHHERAKGFLKANSDRLDEIIG
jgi:hypothetical protein